MANFFTLAVIEVPGSFCPQSAWARSNRLAALESDTRQKQLSPPAASSRHQGSRKAALTAAESKVKCPNPCPTQWAFYSQTRIIVLAEQICISLWDLITEICWAFSNVPFLWYISFAVAFPWLRSWSSAGLMHTSPLILVPPVQSRPCGARSSVRCYSRGGTWRQAPQWWRWLCRTWSASSSGPFASGPTVSYTASTVSLELPAPGCHMKQMVKLFFQIPYLWPSCACG